MRIDPDQAIEDLQAERDEARAEVARLKALLEASEMERLREAAEVERLQRQEEMNRKVAAQALAEMARLRAALAVFVDRGNWECYDDEDFRPVTSFRPSELPWTIAQEALAGGGAAAPAPPENALTGHCSASESEG